MNKNILRFAPSPTGYLHIGNVRTAIFNFLLPYLSMYHYISLYIFIVCLCIPISSYISLYPYICLCIPISPYISLYPCIPSYLPQMYPKVILYTKPSQIAPEAHISIVNAMPLDSFQNPIISLYISHISLCLPTSTYNLYVFVYLYSYLPISLFLSISPYSCT